MLLNFTLHYHLTAIDHCYDDDDDDGDDVDNDGDDDVSRFQHKNVVGFLASFMGEKFPKELEVGMSSSLLPSSTLSPSSSSPSSSSS